MKELLKSANKHVTMRQFYARKRAREMGTEPRAAARMGSEGVEEDVTNQKQNASNGARRNMVQSGGVVPRPSPSPSLERDPGDAVWDFLSSCNPAMTHLYTPFLDYGFTDEEHMGAIMGWPAPKIWNLLQRMIEWPGSGGEMTQLDAEVVWHHMTQANGEAGV